MNALILVLVGSAILLAGYILYGRWLCKEWGVGEATCPPPPTPWKMVLTMSPLRLPS